MVTCSQELLNCILQPQSVTWQNGTSFRQMALKRWPAHNKAEALSTTIIFLRWCYKCAIRCTLTAKESTTSLDMPAGGTFTFLPDAIEQDANLWRYNGCRASSGCAMVGPLWFTPCQVAASCQWNAITRGAVPFVGLSAVDGTRRSAGRVKGKNIRMQKIHQHPSWRTLRIESFIFCACLLRYDITSQFSFLPCSVVVG